MEIFETKASKKDNLTMGRAEDLVRWRTGRDQSTSFARTEQSVESVPSLDQAVLDEIASLQDPGEPEVLADVIRSFLSTSGIRMARMNHSWQSGNALGVARDAHAMTGSAGIIGASRLVELLRRAEKAAVAGDSATTAALMDDLIHEYSRVEFALVQMLREDVTLGS